MTFDEFVAEWRRQVREYGGGVPQEAIDMAEQVWEIATNLEREECAKVCDAYAVGSRQNMADICADKIRMRSNAQTQPTRSRSEAEAERSAGVPGWASDGGS